LASSGKAWHFLVNVWSSGGPSGELSPTLLLHTVLFSVGILPAYRVLIVWVYDRTGSLLLAVSMHASLTASNVIFIPVASGLLLATWSLVLAAALWMIVAVIVIANPEQFSRQPPGVLTRQHAA
jgi:hypothetical protein